MGKPSWDNFMLLIITSVLRGDSDSTLQQMHWTIKWFQMSITDLTLAKIRELNVETSPYRKFFSLEGLPLDLRLWLQKPIPKDLIHFILYVNG